MPNDADVLCKKALFRIAYSIKEEEIPAELFITLTRHRWFTHLVRGLHGQSRVPSKSLLSETRRNELSPLLYRSQTVASYFRSRSSSRERQIGLALTLPQSTTTTAKAPACDSSPPNLTHTGLRYTPCSCSSSTSLRHIRGGESEIGFTAFTKMHLANRCLVSSSVCSFPWVDEEELPLDNYPLHTCWLHRDFPAFGRRVPAHPQAFVKAVVPQGPR